MLVELAVSDLGVLAELSLVFDEGLTAVTGETGAGKTLVVSAIELLVGARAEAGVVRPGAMEARVEGRFVTEAGDEVVLSRVVPAEGRSRAYVDGHLAPVSALAALGADLVDLHGQHAHQSLLDPATQRVALDRFAGIDLAPLVGARARVSRLEEALRALGGDDRARARETDLVRFQVDELGQALVEDPDEDDRLEAEEDRLADAEGHREAATRASLALTDDGGAGDTLATAVADLAGRAPFAALATRLRAAATELADVASDLRAEAEAIEDDPERLEAVRARRRQLADLRRKYGPELSDVIAFGREAAARLADLEAYDERATRLQAERAEALAAVAAAALLVGTARRAAAPALAAAVGKHLVTLAMPRASIDVAVGEGDEAGEVTFLLAANAGEPPLPLARTASGGELARAMLALRLVLTGDRPRTLVFDEMDAGIGGEAAVAVGRALADLGRRHQVLVVTHLPQVAAFADAQVAVWKDEVGGRTVASARRLDEADRVVELSRMLSGRPDSAAARDHAVELLAEGRARTVER